MKIDLIDHMGSDLTVVNAARVSYGGESSELADGDVKLINYLMRNRHTSPFEHVHFTFRVEAPLFVARQWMRHRTWSYNEVSYRYTEPDMEFFLPKKWRLQSSDNKQVSEGEVDAEAQSKATTYAHSTYEHAKHAYQELLDLGVGRELARIILPVGLYTSFYASVDLHNLFHFLGLRDHDHAQEEIRWYAREIKKLIRPIVPVSMAAWEDWKADL